MSSDHQRKGRDKDSKSVWKANTESNTEQLQPTNDLNRSNLLRLQRLIGNRAAQRVIAENQQGGAADIQRDETEDKLAKLREKLDKFDVPEDDVITLLGELSPSQKQTVISDAWYKQKLTNALNFNEMTQALDRLNPPLKIKLEWLKGAALMTNAISYSEIRRHITSANSIEKAELHNDTWKEFFTSVCDNTTIMQAVQDLGLPLQTALTWIRAEASATLSLDYTAIKPFITAATPSERAALNTNDWRSFFVDVCTNEAVLIAVQDLGFGLTTQLEWVREEMSWTRAELSYPQIKDLITKAPKDQREALKTEAWRDFFSEVCTNQTMVDAVLDLDFDARTCVEWLLFEGTDSKLMYRALKDKFGDEALKMLHLASLNNLDADDAKELRQIMDSGPNDRPEYSDTFGAQAKQEQLIADELIQKYTTSSDNGDGTTTKSLDEMGLGKELAGLLATDPSRVRQTLDTLTRAGDNENTHYLLDLDDNVTMTILSNVDRANDDKQLRDVAQNPAGLDLLQKMVQCLFHGVGTPFEDAASQRLMGIITATQAAARSQSGEATEVEVITFLYGGKALDTAGDILGGMRGHTALSVGGMLYSFEAGWSCGQTKEEYLHKNEWRDAVGHVIEIPETDAQSLQSNLNASCGTGVYGAPNICTGEATIALEKALKQGYMTVQNPQTMVGYLESSGIVKSRRYYPRKQEKK